MSGVNGVSANGSAGRGRGRGSRVPSAETDAPGGAGRGGLGPISSHFQQVAAVEPEAEAAGASAGKTTTYTPGRFGRTKVTGGAELTFSAAPPTPAPAPTTAAGTQPPEGSRLRKWSKEKTTAPMPTYTPTEDKADDDEDFWGVEEEKTEPAPVPQVASNVSDEMAKMRREMEEMQRKMQSLEKEKELERERAETERQKREALQSQEKQRLREQKEAAARKEAEQKEAEALEARRQEDKRRQALAKEEEARREEEERRAEQQRLDDEARREQRLQEEEAKREKERKAQEKERLQKERQVEKERRQREEAVRAAEREAKKKAEAAKPAKNAKKQVDSSDDDLDFASVHTSAKGGQAQPAGKAKAKKPNGNSRPQQANPVAMPEPKKESRVIKIEEKGKCPWAKPVVNPSKKPVKTLKQIQEEEMRKQGISVAPQEAQKKKKKQRQRVDYSAQDEDREESEEEEEAVKVAAPHAAIGKNDPQFQELLKWTKGELLKVFGTKSDINVDVSADFLCKCNNKDEARSAVVEIFGLKKGASTFAEEFVIKKWPADKIMASIAQHTQQRPQQNQQAKKSQGKGRKGKTNLAGMLGFGVSSGDTFNSGGMESL